MLGIHRACDTSEGPFEPIVCVEDDDCVIRSQSGVFACPTAPAFPKSSSQQFSPGPSRINWPKADKGCAAVIVAAGDADLPLSDGHAGGRSSGMLFEGGISYTEQSSRNEKTSSTLGGNQDWTNKKVSFSDSLVSQVNYRPKTTEEEWSKLYYTAHEIQKMWDESRAENGERE
eukprot:CAMPEP_0113576922 /NCGR_PEP_ID=MMETSP0015_2-20120614/28580_1 /TAXON_ID=2838 /ORGANISM="Odontella" /LENGTH=172 /DNA_ID=CAMNT_0000480441 /DNA_START=227 /DNA_END=742 /DNA_ORIENTATION=+ /assembly_acc=CAM_ASM_000160